MFSFIASNYSDDKLYYFGLVEVALSGGMLLGPPVGSFLYGYLGYGWAFYFTAIMVAIDIVLVISLVPS